MTEYNRRPRERERERERERGMRFISMRIFVFAYDDDAGLHSVFFFQNKKPLIRHTKKKLGTTR